MVSYDKSTSREPCDAPVSLGESARSLRIRYRHRMNTIRSTMGPFETGIEGPPWSVRIIISGGKWAGIEAMQCLSNPLVLLAEQHQNRIRRASRSMDFRGNNICDAGVTPDTGAYGRADTHLTARRIDPLVAFCLSFIYGFGTIDSNYALTATAVFVECLCRLSSLRRFSGTVVGISAGRSAGFAQICSIRSTILRL
jgi:hypothetical protein